MLSKKKIKIKLPPTTVNKCVAKINHINQLKGRVYFQIQEGSKFPFSTSH